MKYLTHILDKIKSALIEKIHILLVVEVPLWLSPVCLVMEKIKRFDILVFLEVQEINLRGNLRDNKCDEYLIFL